MPFGAVVTCGEGNGVGQPSLSGVIAVAGNGVAPHGAHGISFTATPASGEPVPSSTSVPEALVVEGAWVGDNVGVELPAGGVPPPPPPLHAAAATMMPKALAIKRKFVLATPSLVPWG